MDKVINLGIPHVAELIFESIDTPGLIKYLKVSQTWEELAWNVLVKRWKGKMFEANGEAMVVELLLERCSSEDSGGNIKDEYGVTPFMWACYCGYKDVVRSILDHSEKQELNVKDIKGQSAFMFACDSVVQYDVVKLLLNSDKIELNAKDESGRTALMRACGSGFKDVVKLLMDHPERIELNAKSNNDNTI